MVGKRSSAPAAVRLDGVQVQSSVQGQVIPLGWGTFRVSGNLLWYGDFTSTAVKQSAGKGGGSTTTSYNYNASLIIGLCVGPISNIRTVFKDKKVYTTGSGGSALQQVGFNGFMSGADGQAPWSYLTTHHADQAIGYSGIAYAYVANYALGSSASIGNHTFEIQSLTRVTGLDDANPKDIAPDFLSRVPFWPTGAIADLTDFGNYCLAAGLLLSPVIDNQRTAQDFLREFLVATNSDAVMTDGLLKIVPYGDTSVTGNGVTWTPDLTPIYDLTDDDFLPQQDGDPPVLVDIGRQSDAYNYVQVEFLDRTNQYNTGITIALDQGNIDQYGRNPNPSPVSLHMICDPSVAKHAAQLIVQRSANVRAKFRFRLGPQYGLLQPMDLVTITTGDRYVRKLVRIVSADEATDSQGVPSIIQIEAEEMLVGTAHAAEYSHQPSSGFTPNYAVSPGPIVDYALVCPPRTLTNGDYELWVGACGGSPEWGGAQVWMSIDGTNYGLVGEIDQAARIGTVTAITNVADPDTTNTPTVNLSSSDGTLLPATQADADHAVTMFLVDTEVLAYRDSTLTGTYTYQLGYLRRGLFSTTPAAHANGAAFIRLDSALARIAYTSEQVGTTVHIKLLSFNRYGQSVDSLASATAIAVTLNPGAAPVVDIVSTDTQNVNGRPSATVLSEIDQALANIATLSGLIDSANTSIAQLTQLLDQANDQVDLLLGQTAAQAEAIARGSASHLDLRNIANDWSSLDGERITVPVKYGKLVFSLLGAMNGDQSAFVLNASTVWVSPTQSFAQYQTQVQANYNNLTATVNSNYSTLTTQDTAIANAVIGTSATLNGSYSQSYINLLSINTMTGQLYGSITLKTSTSSGALASMQLLTSSGAVNLGAVVFDVDNFLVKSSSHPAVAPLYFDATTGALFSDQIVARSANIANLAVQTFHVQDHAITTGQTSSITANAYGTASPVLVLSQTFTLTEGATVAAFGAVQQTGGDSGHSSTSHHSTVTLYINGVQVDTYHLDNDPANILKMMVFGQTTCPAGTVTIQLYNTTEPYDTYGLCTLQSTVYYK